MRSAKIIPAGKDYYVDNRGHILIGWHGTYNPPLGMDDKPLIKKV
tara:strand:+ start:161 stop:295 length:135 start_codon:yes stop_codon:yes gene_type:complete